MKLKNIHLSLLLVRLMVGGLMLFHGVAKISKGVGFIEGQLAESGLPAFIAYGVYLGEIVAPLMVILGWRARIGGAIMVATMLMVIYLTKIDQVLATTQTGAWALELQTFFLVGALVVTLSGAGKYAVSKKNKWD